MPAETERRRRFMGAELGRLRRGESTATGMSEQQLSDFARNPRRRSTRWRSRRTGRRMRRPNRR